MKKSCARLGEVAPGDVISELVVGPITRQQIAVYAGASNDFNGIHIDTDVARKAGLDDVIVHGMFTMGSLSRLLTGYMPEARIENISVRFLGMVPVHSVIVCRATAADVVNAGGQARIALTLTASLKDGAPVASGAATLVY